MSKIIPTLVQYEAPTGARTMMVGISYKDALHLTPQERWDAIDSHVSNENGSEVEVFARQFHSYTKEDGYIYKVWYGKKHS